MDQFLKQKLNSKWIIKQINQNEKNRIELAIHANEKKGKRPISLQ